MSRTERIDRTIDSIIGGLESLKALAPQARAHLLAEINLCGEPRAASTEPTVTSSSDTSPTEAAALTAVTLRARLQDIDDTLNALAQQVTNLRQDCQQWIGTRTPGTGPWINDRTPGRQTPRCDGGVNYRGYLTPLAEGGWSNPACQDTPSEGKTCDACEMRASVWARKNPKVRHEGQVA
jgi:hypothetical protein